MLTLEKKTWKLFVPFTQKYKSDFPFFIVGHVLNKYGKKGLSVEKLMDKIVMDKDELREIIDQSIECGAVKILENGNLTLDNNPEKKL